MCGSLHPASQSPKSGSSVLGRSLTDPRTSCPVPTAREQYRNNHRSEASISAGHISSVNAALAQGSIVSSIESANQRFINGDSSEHHLPYCPWCRLETKTGAAAPQPSLMLMPVSLQSGGFIVIQRVHEAAAALESRHRQAAWFLLNSGQQQCMPVSVEQSDWK
jgi:hypothetical protein